MAERHVRVKQEELDSIFTTHLNLDLRRRNLSNVIDSKAVLFDSLGDLIRHYVLFPGCHYHKNIIFFWYLLFVKC